MDDKDTFLTIEYRSNAWIHTCENRTTGKTEVKSQIGFMTNNHRTVAGAKRYITAQLRHAGPVTPREDHYVQNV